MMERCFAEYPALQDYAMQILTEEERGSYLIETDIHGTPLIFSQRGVYAIFFEEQFHHHFYASEHLKPLTVTQRELGYTINIETLGGKSYHLLFLQQRDAHQKANALVFLYAY